MANNPNARANLIPFVKGDPRRINKPKGTISLSTHIKNLLNDSEFEANILDSKKGLIEYKGAPILAIITVAIQRALSDKERGQHYMDWLAKYGYGTNIEGSPEQIEVKYEVVNHIPEPKE